MRNHTPNHAFADALLSLKANGNAKAKTLVVSIRESRVAELEARSDRFNELKRLCDLARIPGMHAPAGYTSRTERVVRELAYLGGEDYEEGLRVLKFARNSKQDWETALNCFGPQQQVVA